MYQENWTQQAQEQLRRFETRVVEATKVEGYDGKDPQDQDRQWSFSGALLYSVTVITTIVKAYVIFHLVRQPGAAHGRGQGGDDAVRAGGRAADAAVPLQPGLLPGRHLPVRLQPRLLQAVPRRWRQQQQRQH
ncbi:hypothetical protein FOCC_FOCC003959 [Frankliniella occidentalis]|nr:hypothetical protein FOCC_FOCC003959 [Frankliniella occidentalis]